MLNEDVARAWSANQPAKTKSMKTDGHDLFSYNLLIGYTQKNGDKIVIDYTAKGGEFHSMSTSTRVGLAKEFANKLQNPKTRKLSTIL